MADVRASVGVPAAAAFGGLGAPTLCAPLIVDSTTGNIYSLKTGDIVVLAGASGTVTSVAETFTGGIISVAGSPITTSGTLALTVAGTSGGVPYFASGTTWASSGALAANAVVLGGGAGNPPATTATGTGVVTALGVNVGSPGAVVTFNGALGTPSSGVATNLTGTAAGLTAGAVAVGGITGLGTGVGAALAVNVGSAGAFVTFGGALGSPSSAGTLPAHTLGGTVSGGGQQLNNVIIGTVTPLAGSFTTVNGNTITTGTGTLTLGAGKTTTFDHTSTFTTTDAQTYTFPTTSATLARTDAANTFTGVQSMTSPAVTTGITTGTTAFALLAGATTSITYGAGATVNTYPGSASVTGTSTLADKILFSGATTTGVSAPASNGQAQLATSAGGGLILIGKGSTNDIAILNSAANNAISVPTGTVDVVIGATIRMNGYTVATLPTGVTGKQAYVTDALAPTFLGLLTGGSTTKTPVFYNGAAWVSN